MAVLVDLICARCNEVLMDRWSTDLGMPHVTDLGEDSCDGILERLWTLTPAPAPGTHPSERVVLYQSAREGGAIQYPGRNDVPMPERLRRRGYERIELNVSDLGRFERQHHVANERRHFDRNGKGF